MKSWTRWLLAGVSALAAIVLYRLIANSRRDAEFAETQAEFERAA
ncbi:MAG: hypothetical protein ACXVQY_00555 [Actinomycetota bacterium]